MFSKNKGKQVRDKPSGGGRQGNDLASMLGFGGPMEPDDDDEDALLAELAALEGRPQPAKKKAPAGKKGGVSMNVIEQMAADSMKDIDDDDINEDDDFDEHDLMNELDDLVMEGEDDVSDEDVGEPMDISPATSTPHVDGGQSQQTGQSMTDDEVRRQEEEDIKLAIALSLGESGSVGGGNGSGGGGGGRGGSAMVPKLQPQPAPIAQPLHPVQAKPPTNDTRSVLEDRKKLYILAIEQAKTEGNNSKVRRFTRGLKELDSLIKRSAKGEVINEDDIPPPVAVKGVAATPQPSISPAVPPSITPQQNNQSISGPPSLPPIQSPPQQLAKPAVDTEILQQLLTKQKEFKVAALKMKQANNIDMARKCLAISKHIQNLIDDVNQGKSVDLSNIPNLPANLTSSPTSAVENEAKAGSSNAIAHVSSPLPAETPTAAPTPSAAPPPNQNVTAAEGSSSSEPPPPPQTIMEAFQQRLAKYQSAEKAAKDEGNGSKARRMGRIAKQYQDAIKCYKANKPIDYSELPCPPGYGPFPGVAVADGDDDTPSLPVAENVQSQVTPALPVPAATASAAAVAPSPAATAPVTAASVIKPSRNQKEHEFLVTRQREFKKLALQAKNEGDMESARDLLRKAKGIDPMIENAAAGLRVDVTQVPPLPTNEKKEEAGQVADNSVAKSSVEFQGNIAQQFLQIENALKKQVETSEKNLEHYKLLGNLDAAKNFQALYQSSQKDLSTLMSYKKQGGPVPKCHTELKTFPVIRSNPHLSDADLELIVVRCTNIPVPSGWTPKDIYTYVTYELPYPPEKPQIGNTTTKKETVNPEFNESFKLLIERKNRAFLRYCRRNGITLKVNYVRGFLKGDKPLGQATIKFEHFNNRCEIHECVDLMDLDKGRKAVGGKIEIRLKIREPLADKDAEIIKENWLVLDTHLRGLDISTTNHAETTSNSTSSFLESLEVLRHEKDLYERKVNAYKSQNKPPPAQLVEAIKSHQQKIHFIQTKMKEGGRSAINEYLVALTNQMEKLRLQAQDALKKNDKEGAKSCLTKKKLIDKEVAVIKQRLGL